MKSKAIYSTNPGIPKKPRAGDTTRSITTRRAKYAAVGILYADVGNSGLPATALVLCDFLHFPVWKGLG